MNAYITSYGLISPQQTHDNTGFPEQISVQVTNRLRCIEPVYRNLINPVQLRRMPRILKMGLASARICLERADNVNPDAIIVGTGLGCLDNLEKFLLEILNTGEHITSVLPFINSTHNAVASQIAMMLKNGGYNLTYCHRAFSFEIALHDTLMHFEEKQAHHVLVGGIDECTDNFMHLHHYHEQWKQPVRNLDLFKTDSPGTIAGEGSAFFLVSDIPGNNTNVILQAVHTFFTPDSREALYDATKELDYLLQQNSLDKDEIDLVILGMTGDFQYDMLYKDLRKNYFSGSTSIAVYKHLSGEFYTASAFALWLGVVILNQQVIPSVVCLDSSVRSKFSNILIYNHHRNTEHAFMLLSSSDRV